ncbi:hypothetical protein KL86DYS1_11725 [uncultured Dysgonomonas sp.]|uniref:Uncharacterized protein n=1 Tax=uncultured Dysgonomonas sp. TaxID=206096 RepID=A0A212JBC2_9BACT|nr:hypothetical protein KL86DYS1_11725 [uncultured Dysgonomonas sp.]
MKSSTYFFDDIIVPAVLLLPIMEVAGRMLCDGKYRVGIIK